MTKPADVPYSEKLHIAHDLSGLADFHPELRSSSQVLRLSTHTKEKWRETIRAEINRLFDSGTFSLD